MQVTESASSRVYVAALIFCSSLLNVSQALNLDNRLLELSMNRSRIMLHTSIPERYPNTHIGIHLLSRSFFQYLLALH